MTLTDYSTDLLVSILVQIKKNSKSLNEVDTVALELEPLQKPFYSVLLILGLAVRNM